MVVSLKGERIPSQHHVGRHCTPSRLLIHEETGQITGIDPSAFRADSDGISVNWLEYHEDAELGSFADMCGLIKAARKVKQTDRVAVMAVSEIEATPGVNGGSLHVEHDPLDGQRPNPGHSLIKGVGPDDTDVLHELSVLVDVRAFA